MISKKQKIISAAIAIMAVTAFALATTMTDDEPMKAVEDDDETLAFLFLLFAAGILVGGALGFSLGFLAAKLLSDPEPNYQAQVDAVMREMESQKVQMAGEAARVFAGSILPSDTILWSFTQEHWNRAAELTVADRWMYGTDYDPNYTLERSMQRANVENYLYNWQASFDELYTRTLVGHVNKWLNFSYMTGSPAVTADLKWDSNTLNLYNSAIDFAQIVSDVTADETIYIDTSTYTAAGTYHQDTSGTIYNLSLAPVTLRYMGITGYTGSTITLAPGANDLSTIVYNSTVIPMDTGLYQIETAGATLAGPITRAADYSAAEVSGTMVFTSGSDVVWFTAENGDTYVNSVGSTKTVISDLSLHIGYEDRNGSAQTDDTFIVGNGSKLDVSPADLINQWAALVEKTGQTIASAAVCGEVLWDIFDVCEVSIPALAPSAMITTIDGVPMNAVQSKAVAIGWMQQVADAYNKYGPNVESLKQTFSAESLSLYVRANIYYNGVTMAENVVFTPYSSLEPQHFEKNKTTTWKGAGYIMVWGYDDITGWTGPTNTSEYIPMFVGTGYQVEVIDIGSKGNPLMSADITPAFIEKSTVDGTPTPDPPAPIILKTAAVALLVFALLVAAGLLIGLGVRGPWILIPLGLIVILVAYIMYDPSVIGRFFDWLWDHTFGRLWPF